jgi:hypothetical protein
MKMSEIFRYARWMIEDLAVDYVCAAVHRVKFTSAYDKTRALDIIQSRLSPSSTVEGWISRRFPKDAKAATDNDFREFRIRWLKALEEEFKQKGD